MKTTTRKLTFNNKKAMFVNAKGKVTAKIMDENGNELALSHTFEGDSTKAQVLFDDFDVSTLNDKVFRLKFMVDGELFSFGFADENGEFCFYLNKEPLFVRGTNWVPMKPPS